MSTADEEVTVEFKMSDARNDRNPYGIGVNLARRFDNFVAEFNLRSNEQGGHAVMTDQDLVRISFPARFDRVMALYIDDAREAQELTLKSAD